MKGSAVVLLACFALFFTAPSHSYSVKFVSEDDEIANRQDTLSGSPSPDVGTTDAAESGSSDTSTDESKTVKMDDDDDDTTSVDEPSRIRKRDTRSMFRNVVFNIEEEEDPIHKGIVLKWLESLGANGIRCFKRAVKYLEKYELPSDSDMSYGEKPGFTRPGMIRWLKIIQISMSECMKTLIMPLENEGGLPDVDDDTPVLVKPSPGSEALTESELIQWFVSIGESLERCFKEAIRVLEMMPRELNNPGQRSSDTVPDLLAELIEVLSKIDGASVNMEDPIPMDPPRQSASPYPDGLPIITAYKKRNYLDKPRGYRYPVVSNLPRLVHDDPLPVAYPLPHSNAEAPKITGYRGELIQKPYPPVITTLPEVYDPGNPNSYPPIITTLPEVYDPAKQSPYSLLDVVLNKIYSKLQGTGSPAVAQAEELRDDAKGVLGLFRGPGRPGHAVGNPAVDDPGLVGCIEECIKKWT